MRVWRNWQTHQILVASLQCIDSLQALAGKNRGKTKYAPVVKLAYTLDFGCVTTVHLFPASSGRLISRAKIEYASMAELADAPDLGSGGEIHAGSIPVTRTKKPLKSKGFRSKGQKLTNG